jgi:hypothetical protein
MLNTQDTDRLQTLQEDAARLTDGELIDAYIALTGDDRLLSRITATEMIFRNLK